MCLFVFAYLYTNGLMARDQQQQQVRVLTST